ncbi:DUF1963 domain-containing protein [Streptomyces sp. SP18CS02]|uniref:DUF1963 domain-containing protein n=1 Tax=Streptomyces sp. SP18CS02 TaxID=3002531 RepID=UPI002E78CC51|nr:DUF1963 domain-containing protein [Streptomyces sp. SP18CS02]MEE1753102.1 DUF1963 domain-containing protein [Streptomyces sp. SP18CS02]
MSGTDHQGRFRRAALELGVPDNEISRFGQHLRLSIGSSGGSSGVPVGQLGGLPRLPVGMNWPSAGNGPLPFIFSVDCGALPSVDGFGLPADGTLLFFLAHEEDHPDDTGRYARVVYVMEGTATAVAGSPHCEFAGKQYDVGATLLAELPPWFGTTDEDDDAYEDWDDLSPFPRQLARDLERDIPHLDELCALAYDLWPDEGLASGCIGGYADDEVVTSIAEQTLARLEKAGEIVIPVAKWSSHVGQEKHRLTSEWMSLARFPVADEYYYGSFTIRHDDLAAARVDKALPVTKFSE